LLVKRRWPAEYKGSSERIGAASRHRNRTGQKEKFFNYSVRKLEPHQAVFDMNFENATVDSIRSTAQRNLAAYWSRLAIPEQGLPPFDQFAPSQGVHDPKQIAVWKVERSGGQSEFRALYRGSFIDEAVKDDWVGKTLTEVAPPILRGPIIEASQHCASSGCAIYNVLRTYDGKGAPIDLERLLLPFGTRGRVQVIVASLQLVSLETKFERRAAVENFEMQTDVVMSLRISGTNSMAHRPKKADALSAY
jgi:hypothetical protein